MKFLKKQLVSVGRNLENLVDSPRRPHKVCESLSEDYWKKALRSFALSVAYTLQFEKSRSAVERALAAELFAEAKRLKKLGE